LLEIEIVVTRPLYEKSGKGVTVIFPIILMFFSELASKVRDSSNLSKSI
jgi:hypothetical protein